MLTAETFLVILHMTSVSFHSCLNAVGFAYLTFNSQQILDKT